MSFIDNIWMKIGSWAGQRMFELTKSERMYIQGVDKRREYSVGNQKEQLTKSHGQDDNVFMNLCGVVIDRSVDLLLSGGVEFLTDNDEQKAYLEQAWKMNRKQITLNNAAELAAQAGHGFIKIVPQGETFQDIPRMIVLDPTTVRVITLDEDISTVVEYQIMYPVEKKGEVIGKRQRIYFESGGEVVDEETDEAEMVPDRWILQWQESRVSGKWFDVGEPVVWEYPFPPIVDWQNLADPLSYRGRSDLPADVLRLQDKINFTASNISKILKLHAHPIPWTKGINWNDDKYRNVIISPGNILPLPENGDAGFLEFQSDLQSSMNFYNELKKMVFTITRTITLEDRNLGQFTDYQLSVLYRDAINKAEMKRLLMGEALEALCEYLLILRYGDAAGEVSVVFGDILPENPDEKLERVRGEIGIGILSKETAAEEMQRNWETEKERIDEERLASDSIGSALVQSFLAQQ